MKKTIFSVFTMASLLVAGFAMIACDNKDNQAEIEEIAVDDPQIPAQTFTLTVNAVKGGDQTTRALTFDDVNNEIVATWSVDDVVKAYKGENWLCDLTPEDISDDGSEATLKGDFTGKEITEGDDLTLKFLSGNYSSQDGTLTGNSTSIDKVCDYAVAEVTVLAITGSSIYTTDADFENHQAIVKFTLVDKADLSVDVEATSLAVTVGSITYNVTPSSATNELWVAIPAIDNEEISLEATTEGGTIFTFNKSGVTFENEKYYEINVKMKKPATLPTLAKVEDFIYDSDDHDLLTSTGTLEGATINYCIAEIEPTIDGGTWSTTIPRAENAGTYNIWYYIEIGEAYSGSDVPVTSLGIVTISKKSVTFSGINAYNKEFDGLTTNTAAVLNTDAISANGFISGDDVTYAVEGEFASISEGNQTVNVTISLSGEDSGNYDVVPYSTTASIIAFLNLSESKVGYYVCSDKSYFSPSTSLPSGKTVVGMIAYVGTNGAGAAGSTYETTPGTGYIIAKSDIAEGTFDAVSADCSSYNPMGEGGVNPSWLTWGMPSKAEWQAMGSDTDLYSKLQAVSMTLSTDEWYWSTTTANGGKHQCVEFTGDPVKGIWQNYKKEHIGRAFASF